MRSKGYSLWAVVGFMLVFGVYTADASGIQWMKFEEGLARANTEHKKIFLNFYAEWCGYCTKMNQETFTNPALIAYMNEHFIPIKVDSDREPSLAQRYRVQGLPTSWFLTEKGEQIANQPGFIPADNLLNMMKYVSTDSYKTTSYKEFLKKKP